jgi:exodeoxyribonuclease-3
MSALSPCKIITWNINSVRLRLPQVLQLLDSEQPDVLCLQETKTRNATFPAQALRDAGYPHQLIHGMPGYNGVAILSKHPVALHHMWDGCGKNDCRHISASVCFAGQPLYIHCLYVPAGGDDPTPGINPKFDHKLDFLTRLAAWLPQHHSETDHVVLCGDLNIAPLPADVYDHKKLLRVMTHTPLEVAHLQRLQESLQWHDVTRGCIPADQPAFTWWSYRAKAWQQANRGRRLDHIWVTPPLQHRICGHDILTAYRSLDRPSDHAPVMVMLASGGDLGGVDSGCAVSRGT